MKIDSSGKGWSRLWTDDQRSKWAGGFSRYGSGLGWLVIVFVLLLNVVRLMKAADQSGEKSEQQTRGEPRETPGRDLLPYNNREIGYSEREPNLPVGNETDPRSWDSKLSDPDSEKESVRERLIQLLERLKVPRESQVLVYSRTSTNTARVSPANPRAIFFQDEIYVAWVPGVDVAEVAIADPELGMVFYTVPLHSRVGSPEKDAERSGAWVRQERCLQCHVTGESWGVPGLLMKSVKTDEEGKPMDRLLSLVDGIDWNQMWGGWYLSGERDAFCSAAHLLTGSGSEPAKVNLAAYPQAGSDPVALLLLTHQVAIQNLLIRYRYEFVLKRPLTAEVPLARAFLFKDVPSFPAAVIRTPFAEVYEGPREGESSEEGAYRRLELKRRLMCSRVSPLLFGRTVQQYPRDLRVRLGAAISEELQQMSEEELSREEKRKLEELIRWRVIGD